MKWDQRIGILKFWIPHTSGKHCQGSSRTHSEILSSKVKSGVLIIKSSNKVKHFFRFQTIIKKIGKFIPNLQQDALKVSLLNI